jgi:predicted cation transporter
VILLIVIILVAAAVTGSLGGVLQVAAGVAIGIILAVIGLGLIGYYYARRRMRQMAQDMERYRQEGYGDASSGYPRRPPRGSLPRDTDPYA